MNDPSIVSFNLGNKHGQYNPESSIESNLGSETLWPINHLEITQNRRQMPKQPLTSWRQLSQAWTTQFKIKKFTFTFW